jgi:hypothetical protein
MSDSGTVARITSLAQVHTVNVTVTVTVTVTCHVSEA